MELQRKSYDSLLKWKKESQGKTSLLIEGARRVGKSYLVRSFGNREYKSCLLIDFGKVDEDTESLFEHDTGDLDLFFQKLSIKFKTPLFRRESLIVFDEVQLFPLARQRLKYFVEDGRYDFIETGSLISIKKNVQDILIPSEEDRMQLNPLDFEEFLWALGDRASFSYIRECYEKKIPVGSLHRQLMGSFRQYLLVGGMPQAVVAYGESKEFERAEKEKRRILDLYREDIAKAAPGIEARVNRIFDLIPADLSKLGRWTKAGTAENSFFWLSEAKITNLCLNANDPSVGLSLNEDDKRLKCYMGDTGLLVSEAFKNGAVLSNDLYKAILFKKLGVNEGMLIENIVAQSLVASGRPLFFYGKGRKRDPESKKTIEMPCEVDFLISKDNKISPLEVKSGRLIQHSSLNHFIEKFHSRIGPAYVLTPKDLKIENGIVYLPLYMASLL
jgi:predicted AAA+ superfamily ATPase